MVTVIIPAYNRPDDLQQALYSLCAQTTSDFKVIVSDDASTENLQNVCDEFGSKLNLTYIKSNKNRGCGGNRAFALNYFLTHQPTEYLMWLDSDDLFLPQAIERLNNVIEHNQADIILTNIWNEYNGAEKRLLYAKENHTWLHGKIYRTQFLLEHNLTFPNNLATNEDLAFNLSLYAYNPNSYQLNDEVYYFRHNSQSITKNQAVFQKCNSIDYIDAIYWAFNIFMDNKALLTNQMIVNIIGLYNFYQRATIFKLMDEAHKQKVRKMIRNKQVSSVIISCYAHPELQFNFDQWVIYNNNLVFFGQSFGNWLMNFFTIDEINQLIKESGLQEK